MQDLPQNPALASFECAGTSDSSGLTHSGDAASYTCLRKLCSCGKSEPGTPLFPPQGPVPLIPVRYGALRHSRCTPPDCGSTCTALSLNCGLFRPSAARTGRQRPLSPGRPRSRRPGAASDGVPASPVPVVWLGRGASEGTRGRGRRRRVAVRQAEDRGDVLTVSWARRRRSMLFQPAVM